MQQSTNENSAEELGKHSEYVAYSIEREIFGVTVDRVARNSFSISYDAHLPHEVADMARDEGFQFEAVFGSSVKFSREDCK